jgi:hypothetical protein
LYTPFEISSVIRRLANVFPGIFEYKIPGVDKRSAFLKFVQAGGKLIFSLFVVHLLLEFIILYIDIIL